MSCKPFKTSEANAKAFLKTKGAIDNFLNIKDLNAFRKENAILKEQAKNKYFPNVKGWNEKLFFENREGTKAIPNKKVFKQIDNINGVYYQQNEPMYSEIYNEQTKNTLLKSRKNIPISKVDIDKLNIPTNVKNYLKWLSENKKDKLKSFSDLINFVYNNDFKNEYYSLFTKQVNPELEKKLTDFLKQFYFDIEETTLSKLKKEFGLNILGVTDIINKTIKVVNENERNVLTLPEEISHAVFELLGSHYKNSPIAKQLYKTVSSWEGYKTIYNEYADIYKNADGTTDWKKVQKEAIGKALAMALVNYNSQSYTNLPLEVKLIIDKIVSYIRQLLGMFSKDIRKLEKNIQFKNLINEIARKVLNNDSDYFKTYNDEGFSTTDYIETLEEQTKEDGGKVVKLMKIVSENGGAITGSLSLRKVGVLKRGKEGLLHDIDTIFNAEELFGLPIARQLTQREFENTKVFNDLKKEYGDSLNYFTNWMHSNENYNAFHYYITSPEINQKIQQKKDEGMFISEIYESLTEEEKKETILIDVFIMPNKLKFVHDDVYDINLSTPEYSYLPKLFVMGRNKDVYDYQNLKYFNDKFKIDDQRNFLYQVQKETTEIKPGVSELFESNPELANIGTPEQYSQYLDTIFPDSKVKDIVYHGSNNKFDKFDKSTFGKNTGKDEKAFYFTPDKSRAASYLTKGLNEIDEAIYYAELNDDIEDIIKLQKLKKDLINIYPVKLNIKNPLIQNNTTNQNLSRKDAIDEAQQKKNDGIIAEETIDYFVTDQLDKLIYKNAPKSDNIIIFEPEQIHILGSKQDIEGFKEFVEEKQTSLEPTEIKTEKDVVSLEIENQINELIKLGIIKSKCN